MVRRARIGNLRVSLRVGKRFEVKGNREEEMEVKRTYDR